MPRIKPQVRQDRQSTILDAAQLCFAQKGFHATSMQEVCRAAGMSPGNLYRYFPSKEAMIEGLCARDIDATTAAFSRAVDSDDVVEAFIALGEAELLGRSSGELLLWAEMRVESTRNPQIAAIVNAAQVRLRQQFIRVMQHALQRGRIAPVMSIPDLAELLLTFSDGIVMRRITDRNFDALAQLASLRTLLILLFSGNPADKQQLLAAPSFLPEPSHA